MFEADLITDIQKQRGTFCVSRFEAGNGVLTILEERLAPVARNLIALHRRGVPVRSVPTRVVYGHHGLSHFDLVRDNLRLSGVYARSLAGLFWRIPAQILARARPREAS